MGGDRLMARHSRPRMRVLPGFAAGFGRPTSQRDVPAAPPPGSYDPAIDAQVGQAQRGYGDLFSDYLRDYGEPGTALGGRAGEDYGLGVQGVERSYQRTLGDLLRDRGRGAEDYQRGVQGLERNYARLGASQTQAARASGTQRGGALAQALAKRTENQAIDRAPMDTNFARFNADSAQSEGWLGEDRGLAIGGLQRSLLRGTEDAATGLGRAGREREQFGLDAAAQRFYQANMPLPGPGATPGAEPLTGPRRRRPARQPTIGTNRRGR